MPRWSLVRAELSLLVLFSEPACIAEDCEGFFFFASRASSIAERKFRSCLRWTATKTFSPAVAHRSSSFDILKIARRQNDVTSKVAATTVEEPVAGPTKTASRDLDFARRGTSWTLREILSPLHVRNRKHVRFLTCIARRLLIISDVIG